MPDEINVVFGVLRIEHVITVAPSETSPRYHGVITFETSTYRVKGENMAASMVVGSFATLSVQWLDDNENTVLVPNPTSWSSSDSSTISITVATGNSQISNVFANKAGTVTITASVDPGDGNEIMATIDITATTTAPPADLATHGVISFTQYPNQIPPGGKK